MDISWLHLALGANTEKLAFGHRGANHPVIDLESEKSFMSSQNHSYVVDENIKWNRLVLRFQIYMMISIEGLVTLRFIRLQTVQFHPEANPGPAGK